MRRRRGLCCGPACPSSLWGLRWMAVEWWFESLAELADFLNDVVVPSGNFRDVAIHVPDNVAA